MNIVSFVFIRTISEPGVRPMIEGLSNRALVGYCLRKRTLGCAQIQVNDSVRYLPTIAGIAIQIVYRQGIVLSTTEEQAIQEAKALLKEMTLFKKQISKQKTHEHHSKN